MINGSSNGDKHEDHGFHDGFIPQFKSIETIINNGDETLFLLILRPLLTLRRISKWSTNIYRWGQY